MTVAICAAVHGDVNRYSCGSRRSRFAMVAWWHGGFGNFESGTDFGKTTLAGVCRRDWCGRILAAASQSGTANRGGGRSSV